MGVNCRLALNVRVINSVVMDNVTLDEGCQLQNCLVCPGAHLQARLDSTAGIADLEHFKCDFYQEAFLLLNVGEIVPTVDVLE